MVFIGLLLWFAFLFAAMVLFGIIWAVSKIALWLIDLKPLPSGPTTRLTAPVNPPVRQRPNVPQVPRPRSVARVPDRPAADTPAASDIWPKWTASYRQYVNQEKSLWQEQFDSLNSRE
ncbi:hypothetical protein QF038_003005 [Pseudarthrobacter sp. W1I19]|uniref:hypothetical protein n=1 Tax=Pseudarthrobacter sp. W1I19 TaxID=3042288 RepID=UPI0027805A7C|nr:hypothetical protein [Pseudarthrobacter sp. W1I19]MDQ0924497.1 hypothetical protein [Pseudarthrobacter sp. W1I19]